MPVWLRYFLLASVPAVCLGPGFAASEPVVVIDRKQVNIRTDATTQSPRIAVLEGGVEVEEIRRHGQWLARNGRAASTIHVWCCILIN